MKAYICSIQYGEIKRYVFCPYCDVPSVIDKKNIKPIIVWQCIHCPTYILINLETCIQHPIYDHNEKIDQILQMIENVPTRVLIAILECELIPIVAVSTHSCYTRKFATESPLVPMICEYLPKELAKIVGSYCLPNSNDIYNLVIMDDIVEDTIYIRIKKISMRKHYESVFGMSKLPQMDVYQPQNFLDIYNVNMAINPHIRANMNNKYTIYIKYLDSANNEKIIAA